MFLRCLFVFVWNQHQTTLNRRQNGTTPQKEENGLKGKKIKDEIVVAALITKPSVREASKACGLSETQIYQRMKEPGFAKLYREARRDLLAGCTVAMQSQLGQAVETMAEIMKDEKTPAQTRLAAAESFVRNALKLNEQTDFAERLEAIERARGMNE